MNNAIKTTVLLAALTALIVWVGQMLGGGQGAMIALVFAAVMNIGSYWFSDRIVIAMYRAQPISESDDPELYSIVHRLALKNHIPMPRLYVIPTESPNAFATGRSPEHAAVAVTAGIRRLLDRQELEGVIAHELAHVTNRDILISSIAATLAGAIMMLANMARWSLIFGGVGQRDDREGGGNGFGLLFSLILAPIAAMLIQMAISRSREYQADDTGARVSREPEALASALRKISAYAERVPMAASPSTAHLFIVNPLRGVSFQNLFSTHPPLEQRIARLEQIASELGQRR
ncbi:MAG: zinc metalloprotease HtpX [Deltaproteobacteria bacterium]|nr:zinc metalloprotease HtpX [Deltaproteobacteria bacterium]